MDPGFKLCAPVLKRAAGRPRKARIRPRSEGAGLGARRRKCTRCDGSSHFGKYCDNIVDPAFGECFDEGFYENVGQQPVAIDEDLDEVPIDDPSDVPIVYPNDDLSEPPNDDPSEAPNGDQPSVVVSSARYVNLANTIVHLSLDMISLPFMLCIALWYVRRRRLRYRQPRGKEKKQ